MAPKLLLPPVIAESMRNPLSKDIPEWTLSAPVLRPIEGFGLIELRQTEEADYLKRRRSVSKKPLFDRFLNFRIE